MASIDMYGPFVSDLVTINEIISVSIISDYALGPIEKDFFIVEYVGRADKDLCKRIPIVLGNILILK